MFLQVWDFAHNKRSMSPAAARFCCTRPERVRYIRIYHPARGTVYAPLEFLIFTTMLINRNVPPITPWL